MASPSTRKALLRHTALDASRNSHITMPQTLLALLDGIATGKGS